MFEDINVGTFDRVLRIVVGLALVAFAFFGPAEIAWKGVGYLGFVPIMSALLRTCPVYSLLGISTAGRKAAS